MLNAADLIEIADQYNTIEDIRAQEYVDDMVQEILDECYMYALCGKYKAVFGNRIFSRYNSHAIKNVVKKLEELGFKVKVATNRTSGRTEWEVIWKSVSKKG